MNLHDIPSEDTNYVWIGVNRRCQVTPCEGFGTDGHHACVKKLRDWPYTWYCTCAACGGTGTRHYFKAANDYSPMRCPACRAGNCPVPPA